MAKGELKLLLKVETGRLQTLMDNITKSFERVNASSIRGLEKYKTTMDGVVKSGKVLEETIKKIFSEGQRGGVWKHYIKELQTAQKEVDILLSKSPNKRVATKIFDNSFDQLKQMTDLFDRQFATISGSGVTAFKQYNKAIEKSLRSANQLQLEVEQLLKKDKITESQIINITTEMDNKIRQFSGSVVEITNKAFRNLRLELIEIGKKSVNLLRPHEFQKSYNVLMRASVGLDKMNDRLVALREGGYLTNEQFDELNRNLINLSTKASSMQKLFVATQKTARIFAVLNTSLVFLRKTFGGLADTIIKTVYKGNFLLTQMGQQLHTLTFYVTTLALSFGGLKIIDEFQKLDVTLKKVSNSFSDYAKNWQFIRETAKATPQTILELTDSFVKLKAYGLDPTDGMLTTIIDTVAALGGDKTTLDSIVRAFGQIQAKGKLMSQELRQLADANIPVYNILIEELGLTKDQIDNVGQAGIDANTALTAMVSWLSRNYGGTAADRVDTLSGRISNLKDVISTFIYAVSESGGGVDYLKDKIASLTNSLNDILSDEGKIRAWGAKLNIVIRGIINGIENGFKRVREIFKGGYFGVFDKLKEKTQEIFKSSDSLAKFVENIIVFFVKLKIVLVSLMGFASLLSFLSTAIELSRRFISAIGSIVKKQGSLFLTAKGWRGFIRTVFTSFRTLGVVIAILTVFIESLSILTTALPEFKADLKALVVVIGKGVLISLKLLASAVTALSTGFAQLIVLSSGAIESLWKFLSLDFKGAWESIEGMYDKLEKVGIEGNRRLIALWTDNTKEVKEELEKFNNAFENYKILFNPLIEINSVKELFDSASLSKNTKEIEEIIDKMKELNIIVEDTNGGISIDINSDGYQELIDVLNSGVSLNEALDTLKTKVGFIDRYNKSMEALASKTANVNSQIEDTNEALDILKDKLNELNTASDNFGQYLNFSYDKGLLDISQLFSKLNQYYVSFLNTLNRLAFGTDSYESSLADLNKKFAENKVNILENAFNSLNDKIQASIEKIKKYKDEFKTTIDSINNAIGDIDSILYDIDFTEKEAQISKFKSQYDSLGRTYRSLTADLNYWQKAFYEGVAPANTYYEEVRSIYEKMSGILIQQKEAYDKYIQANDGAYQDNKEKVSVEEKVFVYQQLRDELEKVKKQYSAVNDVMVSDEETNLAKMQKEADGLQNKIKELNQIIANIQEAKIKTSIDDTPVKDFESYVNSLDGKEIEIVAKILEVPAKKFGGLIRKFARGGFLGGYGGGDKIKALLEAGEFVVRKEAVKKFGVGFLQAINNMTFPSIPAPTIPIPKTSFATGGLAQSLQSYGTVNIVIGDQQFPVISEREVASKLMNYLNKQKRVTL